jgi:hypothetical protein
MSDSDIDQDVLVESYENLDRLAGNWSVWGRIPTIVTRRNPLPGSDHIPVGTRAGGHLRLRGDRATPAPERSRKAPSQRDIAPLLHKTRSLHQRSPTVMGITMVWPSA